MKKLGLGLIGTGVATRELHAPALKALKNKFRLVAAVNRTRSKAEIAAKAMGIEKVVDTVDELLALKEVDAVLISVPIEQTAALTLKALKAGKHVLAEKPIAANPAQAKRLIASASKIRKTLMIAENWYFWDIVVQMRKWVQQGAVGKVRLVEVSQNIHLDTKNMYYQTKWRQKPKFAGGFIVDGGVHIANALRELFGQPKKVKSLISQINPLLPPADTMLSIFEFPKQVQGLWKYSYALHDTQIPIMTIQGDKGNIALSWGKVELRRVGAKPKIFKEKSNSYKAELEAFYRSVALGKPLAFKPQQALGDLELMTRLLKGR